MIYGYCRCSTKKQKIDRQKENILRAYPSAVIVCDYYSGRSLDRPNWTSTRKKFKKQKQKEEKQTLKNQLSNTKINKQKREQ